MHWLLKGKSHHCHATNLSHIIANGRGCILPLQRRNYREEGQEEGVRSSRKPVLLIVPAITFCLGCWQWRRHLWKTNLLKEIREGLKQPPVDFPLNNLAELDKLEYRKVRVRGTYLYDRQLVIIWRSRFDEMQGEIDMDKWKNGSQIITPLRLEGTDLVIMVNRGWMPADKADSELDSGKRRAPERVEFNGVVRKSEKPSKLLNNQPESGMWVYKDIEQMARLCNAAPILLDADYESTKPGGPIGGQTNVNLRNEHFNYMLQW